MRKKFSPHLVALIAFSIFIAVFSLAYYLIPSSPQNLKNQAQILEEKTVKTEIIPSSTIYESESKPKIVKIIPTINNNPTNAEQPVVTVATNTTAFTFQTDDKIILSEVENGANVIDAMKKLQLENKITFAGKEFPNLGFFINTINGQSEDRVRGLYWFLYVNDVSSNIGASQYIIKSNDKIQWKLKKSNI